MRLFREIKYGIRNLLYYFKTIWNDRDWDFQYFYQLLEKKLYRMLLFYSNKDILIEDAGDIALQITVALSACKRLIRDEYYKDTGYDWKLEDALKDQDRKILFGILSKYLEYWWE